MFDDALRLLLAEQPDRSARGIAGALSRLVTLGNLAPGAQLPPVRRVAETLGCSPTTVNEAWQLLSRHGVIDPRGRSGTFVRPIVRRSDVPNRYRRVTSRSASFAVDLSTGTPDPLLLPNLRRALSFVERDNLTSSYLDRPVLPELEDAIRAELPFEPESLTVVDGALDALDRIATLTLRRGDRVVVEQCAFPPLLDLLALLGVELIPAATDHAGITPSALRTALALAPAAIFTQPRAHNPLGCSSTPSRVAELADVLRGHETLIVEDDHSGAISAAPDVSLAAHIPGQVLHITSFSKSHGPDLRLASIAGPETLVSAVAERRTLGPGWSSRILQAVLASLLIDRVAVGEVSRARDEYLRRRRLMVTALQHRGVVCRGGDGLNLWVDVPDERDALMSLAAHGIAASPGSPFVVAPDSSDHLRMTVGLVADGYDQLAARFATAASPGASRGAR